MIMTTVFKVVGYEMKTPEGQFFDSTVFWVYAKDNDEAINKAKAFKVKKKYYDILEVIEKYEDVTS